MDNVDRLIEGIYRFISGDNYELVSDVYRDRDAIAGKWSEYLGGIDSDSRKMVAVLCEADRMYIDKMKDGDGEM